MVLKRYTSVLSAMFLCLLIAGLFNPVRLYGQARDSLALRAASDMPFPAFLPLDYYAGRAQAWMKALELASPLLPSAAISRLWELDCNSLIGRLALASLLFPIEAATPDISSSRKIEVFLKNTGEDLSASAMQILEDPEIFLFQLALMLDMGNILKKVEKLRPESVAEAERLAPELDPLAESLEQIWNISRALQDGESIERAMDKETGKDASFLSGMIKACEKRLEAQDRQAALAIAEEALYRLEHMPEQEGPEILNKYLQARFLHLRGLAHWRQSQLALAEKDLARAAGMLKESGLPLALRGRLFLDLGALRKDRRDINGMCAAYRNACVFGQCGPLAEQRWQGLCQGND